MGSRKVLKLSEEGDTNFHRFRPCERSTVTESRPGHRSSSVSGLRSDGHGKRLRTRGRPRAEEGKSLDGVRHLGTDDFPVSSEWSDPGVECLPF